MYSYFFELWYDASYFMTKGLKASHHIDWIWESWLKEKNERRQDTTYFLEAFLKVRKTSHCIAPPPWTFASVDATAPCNCGTSSDNRGWCCNNCKGIPTPPPNWGHVSGGSRGRRGSPDRASGDSNPQNPSRRTLRSLTSHSLTSSLEKNPLSPDSGRKDQRTFSS